MWGTRYLAAYAIGMVIGVINEHVQKPFQPCYQVPDYTHVLTCGVANVYGWSLVGLTMAFDILGRATRIPTSMVLLAMPAILTALEATMGEISKWYFGEQRWKYPPEYCTAFGGTISIVSSAYFAIAGMLYWLVCYKAMRICEL